MERVDCAIVRHHDDGSVTVTAWVVTEERAREIAALLGEPQMYQMFDSDRADTLDAVAELAVTVER